MWKFKTFEALKLKMCSKHFKGGFIYCSELLFPQTTTALLSLVFVFFVFSTNVFMLSRNTILINEMLINTDKWGPAPTADDG